MLVRPCIPVAEMSDEKLQAVYADLLECEIISGRQVARLWAVMDELQGRGYVLVNEREWRKEGAAK